MKLYIPSRDRANRTSTIRNITDKYYPVYVVPKNEIAAYRAAGIERVIGVPINSIAPTRQWIMDYHWRTYRYSDPILVMLDDDLRFDKRRKDDPSRLLVMPVKESEKMFGDLEKLLMKHAHGGILGREGGNRITERVVYNHRTCRVIGFNLEMVNKVIPGAKLFGAVPVQDDFHATLLLLRRGLKNAVLSAYVNGQGGSGSKGGASVYRDMAFHNASVEKLRSLHPDFVRVVTKKTKVAWGGQERNDVIISWKKAYEEGLQWAAKHS